MLDCFYRGMPVKFYGNLVRARYAISGEEFVMNVSDEIVEQTLYVTNAFETYPLYAELYPTNSPLIAPSYSKDWWVSLADVDRKLITFDDTYERFGDYIYIHICCMRKDNDTIMKQLLKDVGSTSRALFQIRPIEGAMNKSCASDGLYYLDNNTFKKMSGDEKLPNTIEDVDKEFTKENSYHNEFYIIVFAKGFIEDVSEVLTLTHIGSLKENYTWKNPTPIIRKETVLECLRSCGYIKKEATDIIVTY